MKYEFPTALPPSWSYRQLGRLECQTRVYNELIYPGLAFVFASPPPKDTAGLLVLKFLLGIRE
jgi:hypothetical protein